MPITERGHDPRGLLRRVYDDHQPARWSNIALEEPFPIGPWLWFPVGGRFKSVKHRLEMRL